MMQTKIYKGIDLLDKILEFSAMTLNENNWTVSALSSNPPRQIRLRQINALLSAFFHSFHSPVTIQSILSGDFIFKRSIEDYKEIIALMHTTVEQRFESSVDFGEEIELEELDMPYLQLLEYKKILRNLFNFNSEFNLGLFGGSVPALFSIFLTESISKQVANYASLDTALELFINPQGLQFTEEELKEKYNYPQENLQEIDIEYW